MVLSVGAGHETGARGGQLKDEVRYSSFISSSQSFETPVSVIFYSGEISLEFIEYQYIEYRKPVGRCKKPQRLACITLGFQENFT